MLRPSRASRQARRQRQWARRAFMGAGWLVGGMAILVAMIGIGLAVHSFSPSSRASVTDQLEWIPLKSQSTTDIQAAFSQSRIFHLNTTGAGDHPDDLTHLGVPQFVAALRLAGYPQPVDSYAIPVINPGGRVSDVAVGWLNQAHDAIYVAYIHSFEGGLSSWPTIPDAQSAVTAVQSQSHVGLNAGGQPRLVYFPYNYLGERQGKVHWTVGGKSPDEPIWFMVGTDGIDRFVGADTHVYGLSDLPLATP